MFRSDVKCGIQYKAGEQQLIQKWINTEKGLESCRGPLLLKSEAAGGLGFLPPDHRERRPDQGEEKNVFKKLELFRQDPKLALHLFLL